ncbi:glycosyltransferase [Spirochaetota bacterium]
MDADGLDVFFSPFNVLSRSSSKVRLCYIHDIIPILPLIPKYITAGWKVLRLISPELFYYLRETIYALRHADIIFTPSSHVKEDLLSLSRIFFIRRAAETIHVNYQIIDNAFFSPPDAPGEIENTRFWDTKSKNIALGEKYIVSAGGRGFRKNNITLLRAYDALPREIKKNLHLVLLYDIGQKNEFVRICSRNIGFIHVLGNVEDNEYRAVIRGSYMLVFPSVYEGFGLPPAEAMALGIPVIVSGTSSLPEVVGEAGIKVKTFDRRMLTQKIEELYYNSTLYRELSVKGAAAAARFRAESHVMKLDAGIKHTIS